jgi:hypothetical protein
MTNSNNDRGLQRQLLDGSDGAAPTKRVKHQPSATSSTADMQIETLINQHNSTVTPSADDILVQMVQCGDYSHDQVVQFCISSGIPLSRMLRLDLMRLSKQKKKE